MIPDLEERQKWCNAMLESKKGSLEPISGALVIKLVAGVLPHSFKLNRYKNFITDG